MGDGLDGLDAWATRQRADEAIGARARAGWLRRQAEDEATWLGALGDLVGCGDVTVTMIGGRTWRGSVLGVGSGYCALELGDSHVLVRPDSITTLTASGGRPPTGDRVPIPNELAHALAAELYREPFVTLWFGATAEPVRGRLIAVSDEVVTLRLVEGPAAVVARLQSVSEVLLATSG